MSTAATAPAPGAPAPTTAPPAGTPPATAAPPAAGTPPPAATTTPPPTGGSPPVTPAPSPGSASVSGMGMWALVAIPTILLLVLGGIAVDRWLTPRNANTAKLEKEMEELRKKLEPAPVESKKEDLRAVDMHHVAAALNKAAKESHGIGLEKAGVPRLSYDELMKLVDEAVAPYRKK